MVRARDRVDGLLGRVSMYRLVTIVLSLLVVVYTLFTATGVVSGLSTVDNLVALLVVLVASDASNRLLGLAFRVRPHAESSLITALLLYFLFVPLPSGEVADLAWFAGAAALANASKYLLAWRGRHVLNPAAAGALLVVLAQWAVGREGTINALWQTPASEAMLPFVAVGALLVLWRTRRIGVGLVCVVVAGALVVLGLTVGGDTALGEAARLAVTSYPIIFLSGFMLSEPLTLPPRAPQQWTVAAVVGVLLALPTAAVLIDWTVPSFGPLSLTPEVALLLGNLVAFGFARRTGVALQVRGVRRLAGDTWEIDFATRRPVRFRPGQYLEVHLPHRGVDSRGVRRVFSISSPPHADGVTLAVRVPEEASSFKRSLVALEPGQAVRGTGVHGDFVWGRGWRDGGNRPLALVAGGIGVTPFLSQVRARQARDVVLVYGLPDGDVMPYRDELIESGVRVVVVSPNEPADLPDGWSHVASPALTPDAVAEAVPDLADRIAFVSGPPAMVDAVRPGLRRRCVALRTDAFTGY